MCPAFIRDLTVSRKTPQSGDDDFAGHSRRPTFIRGFKEAIGLAVVIVGGYLVLNVLVIGSGLSSTGRRIHSSSSDWYTQCGRRPLALGAQPADGDRRLDDSGDQLTAVSQVGVGSERLRARRGGHAADHRRFRPTRPRRTRGRRAQHPRKLLITAAVIMSLYLLSSSLVTATLIPPARFGRKLGPAADRALA